MAGRDIAALEAAGLSVSVVIPHTGLVEAQVSKEGEGHTRIHFQPVSDDIFGWRLHMVDLAINKAFDPLSKP